MSTLAYQLEAPKVAVPVDTRTRRQKLAENLFLIMIAVSLFNIAAIYVRFRHGNELAINPTLIALTALAIPIANPPKNNLSKRYFVVAWIFIVLYTVIGTASIQNVEDLKIRVALQDSIKLIINFIAIPWIAIRMANPRLIKRTFQLTSIIAAIGSIFAIIENIFPGPFQLLIQAEGRAGGFWLNPNNLAVICLFAGLFSFIWPFKSATWNLIIRICLGLGIAVSGSRAAYGAVVLAIVVIALVRKNLKTAVWATVLAGLVWVATSTVNFGDLAARLQPGSRRAASIAALASGEVAGVVQEDIRWKVWQYAGRVALDNWAIGCGLTCMDHVAPFSSRGLGPHNFYIYVMGTSGFLALVGLLIYIVCLLKWSFEVPDEFQRAIAVASVIAFAQIIMFDHGAPATQALCPIWIFFAVFCADAKPA